MGLACRYFFMHNPKQYPCKWDQNLQFLWDKENPHHFNMRFPPPHPLRPFPGFVHFHSCNLHYQYKFHKCSTRQRVPGLQILEHAVQMVGSEFNCMRGKHGEKMSGKWGESEGTPVNILNKDHSSILDATTLLLVDRLWHLLLTPELWWCWWWMRHGGEATSVIESCRH